MTQNLIRTIDKNLREFSRKNWWVFIVFFLCLAFIFMTDSWSIVEILLVFIVYFFADLCIMIMVNLIEENDYKTASIFQLLWNIIFTLLFLYHFIINGQGQYILGSIGFLLWVWKNISLHHYKRDISWINNFFLITLNILIYVWAYVTLDPELTGQLVLQTVWITLFTWCLVMKDVYPRARYFQGFIGLSFLVLGSWYGIYLEYLAWNIYGVTISYFLMPLTVLWVYTRSLKKYI